MFLTIAKLIPTQNDIRSHEKCAKIVEYIKEGRIFRHNPVRISRFRETIDNILSIDKLYIHDGHHRLAAMDYCGLNYLYPDEYLITDYEYKDYYESNPDKGWITPFDPRTHVRVSDLSTFKNITHPKLLNLYGEQIYYEDVLLENSCYYSEPRNSFDIQDCYSIEELEKYL